MSEGKKIVFEGVDNVSKVANTITSSFEKLNKESSKGTESTSRLIKEQNKEHEKLISLLEKEKALIKDIANLGHSSAQRSSTNQLVDRFFTNPESINPGQIGKFSHVLQNNVDKNLDVSGLNSKIIEKLQELIELQKKDTEETTSNDDKNTEQIVSEQKRLFDIRGNEVTGRGISESNERRVYDEKGKLVKGYRFDEEKQKQEKNGDGLINSMRSTLSGGIEGFLHNLKENFSELGEKSGIGAGGLAAGFLGFEAISKLLGTVKEQRIGEVRENTSNISEEEREIERTKRQKYLVGGILGDPGGNVEIEYLKAMKHYREEEAIKSSKASLFSVAGRSNLVGENEFLGEEMGVSLAETYSMGGNIARTRGSSKNLMDEIYGQLRASKAGVGSGAISGLQNLSRFATGDRSTGEYVDKMAENTSREKLNENLESLVSITRSQIGAMEKVNIGEGIAMIKNWSSINSPLFQNAETRNQIMSKVSSSMANPQNDFQKARMFSILSKRMPEASYSQLMEAMESPESQKGLFQDVLDTNRSQFGNGKEARIVALQKQTGLSFVAARKIIEAEDSNRGMFKNDTLGGVENFTKASGIDISGSTIQAQKDIARYKNKWMRSGNPDLRSAEDLEAEKTNYQDAQHAAGRDGAILSDRVKNNFDAASTLAKDAGTLTKEAADIWKKNGDDLGKVLKSMKDTLLSIIPYNK